MKQKTIKVDARLYDAAAERLSQIGFDNLNFAVEYFLAECVVRKNLPSFLRNRRSCPACKFYDPSDGQKLFTRFGKWSANLDLKTVQLKLNSSA